MPEIKVTGDFSEPEKLFRQMIEGAGNTGIILGDIVRPEVMATDKRSFMNQINPYGDKWHDSKLAIKEGRPGQTMLRTWQLFHEQEDINSYPIEGNEEGWNNILEKTPKFIMFGKN